MRGNLKSSSQQKTDCKHKMGGGLTVFMDCHKNLWTSAFSGQQIYEFQTAHMSFILHLKKGLFAQPLTNENTTRCKTSCISSLVITKHSVFTLALLVSIVFFFSVLFNLYYAVFQFAIWKLILGVHTFDPVLALIVILISSVVYL